MSKSIAAIACILCVMGLGTAYAGQWDSPGHNQSGADQHSTAYFPAHTSALPLAQDEPICYPGPYIGQCTEVWGWRPSEQVWVFTICDQHRDPYGKYYYEQCGDEAYYPYYPPGAPCIPCS
jgi:hypothetical protein